MAKLSGRFYCPYCAGKTSIYVLENGKIVIGAFAEEIPKGAPAEAHAKVARKPKRKAKGVSNVPKRHE